MLFAYCQNQLKRSLETFRLRWIPHIFPKSKKYESFVEKFETTFHTSFER